MLLFGFFKPPSGLIWYIKNFERHLYFSPFFNHLHCPQLQYIFISAYVISILGFHNSLIACLPCESKHYQIIAKPVAWSLSITKQLNIFSLGAVPYYFCGIWLESSEMLRTPFIPSLNQIFFTILIALMDLFACPSNMYTLLVILSTKNRNPNPKAT